MGRFHLRNRGTITTVIPTLVPGSEGPGVWATTTSETYAAAFAAQGDSGDYGYDQTAIANWDTVPYQDFTGDFYVGVVAFHVPTSADYALGRKTGIAKVEFSVNNGAWASVTTTSTNPNTGVVCYVAKLRASDFSDGQVEIRAVAYPRSGVPRVLQGTITSTAVQTSLFLSANAGGTLPAQTLYIDSVSGNDTTGDGSSGTPYATLYKGITRLKALMSSNLGGGVLYLKAGSYGYDDAGGSGSNAATTRWVTIQPAPGVDRASVTIATSDTGDGIRTGKVRLKNVTITAKIANTAAGVPTAACWLDGSSFVGSDRTISNSEAVSATFPGGTYITDSSIYGVMFAARTVNLWRNTTINHISSDAFHQGRTMLNCTVSDVSNAGTSPSAHPDIFQVYGSPQDGTQTSDNYILYGITATSAIDSQLLFFDDNLLHKNIAVVNCHLKYTGTGRNGFHTNNDVTHLLILNSIIDTSDTGSGGWNGHVMTDLALVDTTWPGTYAPEAYAGVLVLP